MAIQSTNVKSRARNRRNIPANSRIAPGGVNAAFVSVATVKIVLALDVPVSLVGIPQFATTGANGSLPIAAAMTSAQTLELTYALTQAASTEITIPAGDSALRSYAGGLVNAQAVTIVP